MATKPLKTLTFEGLNDTYTVPQVDATLAVTGGAADAKVTGDTLAEKADKDGVIATAEGLIGGAYTVEKEPYHFRKTAVDLAGRLDETIVGGSLGWNQLCNGSSVTVQSGHKYIAKIGGAFSIGASTGTAITGLTSGTDMVIDLTTCFGSTIADYIYSLETATAGAGVAFVKRYLDLYTYHKYDAGSIQSVEGLVSHDVVGFNQWDEEWESGSINSSGVNYTDATAIRSKNYIPVISGLRYYFLSAFPLKIRFYNSEKTFVSPIGWPASGALETTIPDNVSYLRFATQSNYGTTYKHDICINLSDPLKNGTYEPYEKHSYPLDSSVTLRGVPKLVTDHIEFDGDKYRSDGTVERRYGVVDLGTLNWNYVSTSGQERFYSSGLSSTIKKPADDSNIANVITTNYSTAPLTDITLHGYDKVVAVGSNGYVAIRDTSYSDAATFKTAMSGVYLVYELATPTTETAQPFQSPMIVGATEEYISDSVVPVGHESKYYEDVAKKVSGLPKDFSTLIAPVEVTFTATRNYSVGSYLIVKNQLYKVTSAISSGGTITPNSNVTATTIMAEILALA